MTVATFIGVGETPAQVLGKTLDTAHGAGRAGTAASGPLSSTVPAATSFRSGWQSLLASMGSGVKAATRSVSESDQGNPLNRLATEQIPETTSASTLAAIISLRQEQGQDQGTETENVETSAEMLLSSTGVLAQTLLAEQASTSVEEKKPAAEPGTDSATESTHSSRPARPTNTTKTNAVSTEPLPGLVPAAIASLSQAVPAAAVVNQIAQSTDKSAQLAQTGISAALSTDPQAAVASASLDAHPPVMETPGNHVDAVNATMQQTAEGPEKPAWQRLALPVSNLNSSYGSTLSEAESAVADKGAPPVVAMLVEGGKTAEISAPARGLTLTAAQNSKPAETLATSQVPSQTLDSNRNRTPMFVQSQEQVAIQQGNLGVNAPIPGDGLSPLPVTASAVAQSGQLSAQLPALGKPGSAGGGKSSTPESMRGSGNSVQQVSHPIVGQSAVDTAAMARALAGAAGIVSTASDAAGASSTAATGPDSREAFATLDAAGAPMATTWIHAGTQRAEAGYQDPALGWIGVRADLSGGGVHAQLVPGSADAAQALGSHLAGLNAYLAEHYTPVETLSLTSPESGWSGLGSGQDTGEGTQQGAGQQSAQNADASTPSGQSSQSVIQSPAASAELPAFFGDMDGITHSASLDGFHISVMA